MLRLLLWKKILFVIIVNKDTVDTVSLPFLVHHVISIYYLLNGNDFSAWHILKSDELWHYYKGSLVKIYMIDTNNELHILLLGDPTIIDGARFQVTITASNWFAAEIVNKNSYFLVGCTVNP